MRVDSDVALPELPLTSSADADARANLLVRLHVERRIAFDPNATFLRTNNCEGQDWLICTRGDGGYVLRFVGLADFFVNESGDVVECCGIYGATVPEILRHLLLDAVIPRVLDLRGFDAIHATAVSIDGTACAFLGPAGAGKSTLATDFALTGTPLLGDDCVVLSITDAD